MKTLYVRFVCLAGSLLAALVASAQSPALDWFSIDGGGGTSTVGVFALSGTIGQSDAGQMSGSGYTVSGGFWSIGMGVASVPSEIIFDNTLGEENGVEAANATAWLANKFCVGSQPYRLDSLTLPLRSLSFSGVPPPMTVRLQIYLTEPLTGKPSASTGALMNLAGMVNPITLPSGTTVLSVTWTPAAPFNLSADTCYWAVLSVENGIAYESASGTFPTGPLGTYGRTSSSDAGATWLTPDRITNRKMLIRGTAIPISSDLIIAISTADGELRFSFPTISGRNYVIESRADLNAGAWADVPGTSTGGTGAELQVTIPNAFSQPRQFYQVEQLP